MYFRAGIIVLTLLVCAGAGAAVYASIPSPGGEISACYTSSGGALRVIDASVTNCKKGETSLVWNVQGAPGATGATGPTGPTGPQGDTGAPGPGLTIYVVSAETEIPAFTHLEPIDRSCEAGDLALAGSYDMQFQATSISAPERSERTSATTWTFGVGNTSNFAADVTLEVVCADMTP